MNKIFMGCLWICCSILISCETHAPIDANALKLALKSDSTFIEYEKLKDSLMLKYFVFQCASKYRFWDGDSLRKRAHTASLTAEGQAYLEALELRNKTFKRMAKIMLFLENKYPDLKKMPLHEKTKLYQACRTGHG